MGIMDGIRHVVGGVYNGIKGLGSDSQSQIDQRKKQEQEAAAAAAFANQGQAAYGSLSPEMAAMRSRLAGLADGKDSMSVEQLRQGLQQNLGAQQAMAASATPNNSVMAARTAAIQGGRLGAGMSGQAAMAGIAERNAATAALANFLQQQRQQELQAALQSRQTAVSAHSGYKPEGSFIDKYGPAIVGGIGAMSDRNTKTNIRDAKGESKKILDGLKSYRFKYKDAAHGDGDQFGVMAQDLEKAGLSHAIVETPAGKMVHGAKLATANTAMLAELGKRVSNLEGGRR